MCQQPVTLHPAAQPNMDPENIRQMRELLYRLGVLTPRNDRRIATAPPREGQAAIFRPGMRL